MKTPNPSDHEDEMGEIDWDEFEEAQSEYEQELFERMEVARDMKGDAIHQLRVDEQSTD